MNIQAVSLERGSNPLFPFRHYPMRITPKYRSGQLIVNKRLLKRIQKELNITNDNFQIKDSEGYNVAYVIED